MEDGTVALLIEAPYHKVFFSNLLTNINKDFICLKIPRVSSVLVWHFQLDLEQATR